MFHTEQNYTAAKVDGTNSDKGSAVSEGEGQMADLHAMTYCLPSAFLID